MTRKILLIALFAFSAIQLTAQNEPFTRTTINTTYKFRHPFEVFMDPAGDSLWVNERIGRIYKVSKVNGGRRLLLDISGAVTFFQSSTDKNSIAQDGMFGMALHPNAFQGLGKDTLYVAYCYNGTSNRRTKIVKFAITGTPKVLTGETILLQNLPASNDHNGGRLVIGPDLKLYYSCGDQGANQFGNACVEIKSQKDISAAELSAGTYTNYAGHILRLNLDGTVPSDNPTFATVKSHVFSKGHRNPQGLTFEKNNNGTMVANGKLYGSEQGPVTDDEVNIIQSGKNYGWPAIVGFRDDKAYTYKNWSVSGVCGSYASECQPAAGSSGSVTETSNPAANFTDPLASMAVINAFPSDCNGSSNGTLFNRPTVAWSSVEYFTTNIGIPLWNNSLLLPTLKYGTVVRYKLTPTNDGIADRGTVLDTFVYFKSTTGESIRYRDIAVDFSTGKDFYIITDSSNKTSGPSGDVLLTDALRGSILKFSYTGVLLSLPKENTISPLHNNMVQTYPNPAVEKIIINTKDLSYKPFEIKLYNSNGVPVLQKTTYTAYESLDIKHLPNGQYVLQVYNRNSTLIAIKKVIIAH